MTRLTHSDCTDTIHMHRYTFLDVNLTWKHKVIDSNIVIFMLDIVWSRVDADQSKCRSIRNSTEAPHDPAICAMLIHPIHPTFRRRRDFPFSSQLTADFAQLPSDPGSI